MGRVVKANAPAALLQERAPVSHSTGGWVDLRAGLERREDKIACPLGTNPDRPARSDSIYRLRYPGPYSYEGGALEESKKIVG